MRAIFGVDPKDKGDIHIKNKKVKIMDPGQSIQEGMAFLTEDRTSQGLVLAQSVRTNLILASMKNFS
jgi:ribose transport system ATP-binding protein